MMACIEGKTNRECSYFLGGLGGMAMIAKGRFFCNQSRRMLHQIGVRCFFVSIRNKPLGLIEKKSHEGYS